MCYVGLWYSHIHELDSGKLLMDYWKVKIEKGRQSNILSGSPV